jgi:hypothetical protein
VALETKDNYIFGYRAVLDRAPAAAGVYIIHSARGWVHVGAADDLRAALLTHLNGSNQYDARPTPLSFCFEGVPFTVCAVRCRTLIAELAPASTSDDGEAFASDCSS